MYMHAEIYIGRVHILYYTRTCARVHTIRLPRTCTNRISEKYWWNESAGASEEYYV